jgi:PAS domain S-box-containing protein
VKNRLLQLYYSLSLRSHLILLACLLALPAVVLIIHSGTTQRQDAIRKGFWEARRMVSGIATEQYNITGDVKQLLTALAQIPEIKRHNAVTASALLSDILKKSPQYGNIVIADRSGTVWASALPMTKAFSLKDRRTFRNTVKTRQLSSGEYVIGTISAKPTLGFAYPIINAQGEINGVIAANIRFDIYNTLLNQADLPKGSTFSLIDHNGVIIYRNLDTERFVGTKIQEKVFQRMKSDSDKVAFIDLDMTGDKRIVSYRALNLPGEQSPYLYIRASIPLEGVLEKASRAQLYNIAILSSFLLLAILMAIPIGNTCFIRRIHRLQDASHRLAEGDLQVRASESVTGGELGELAQSFDRMALQLSEREQVLRKNQRELDDLYNNAPCGYHSLDKDGLIVRMNDTELRWLGYTRDELVGKIKFTDILTPGSLKVFEKSFPLLKKRGWSRDLEFELVRRDGTIIPALINATTVNDQDGTFLYSRSTAYDVTERKKAERELHELNQSLAKRVEEEIEKRLGHERLLARHARLAAIGEMIGAIAHQWRQPLATLGAIIQGIRMAWEDKCMDNAFLENAEADAQTQLYYMSDTIEGFRNFFSPEKVVEQFDTMKKIHEVALLVAPQFADSGVRLEIVDHSLDGSLEIKGYQNEFKQSILNLVSNSLDSIVEKNLHGNRSEGGQATDGLVIISVAGEDDNVVIQVRDNGCGIPSEYGDKVFEPYFTSKSAGKGTGIGLYMSKLIVEESMGGRLSYTSGPDGTVFRIELARNAPGVTNGT